MKNGNNKNTPKNIVVIGGGPAGMMAAISASCFGAKVTILEKNPSFGKKLLITGGGRCNITNNIIDNKVLLKKYKDAEKYLFSTFSQFDVKDTIEFFEKNGLKLKEEPGGRMFPTTDKSESVLKVLLHEIEKNNITYRTNTAVKNIITKDDKAIGLTTEGNNIINCDGLIIATGGLSHRETGCTGDGFRWLSEIGHKINEPNASLVPVITKEKWTHELSGVAMDNVSLSIYKNGKAINKKIGKLLFTHFGLSGPLCLNMSKEIRDIMKSGKIKLIIDLYPKLDNGSLDKFIQEKITVNQNRKIKNAFSDIIEKSLIEQILLKTNIDGEKYIHQLKGVERKSIVKELKNIELTPTGFLGNDKAIITSGGVPLDEINTKKMSSLLYPNIYVVGDLLDIDRPSGGFSLQLCWTTGYVAGKHSAE